MARETSGGRIGRTVYLPPGVWAWLDRLANRQEQHPAIGWGVRQGSVSSVIEVIVTWDAHREIEQVRAQVTELQARVEVLRRLQAGADAAATSLEARTAEVLRLLRDLARR